MTREEFIQKSEELQKQETEIRAKRSNLFAEYKESLNAPYEHLLSKKVRVTYKTWGWRASNPEEETAVCYWGGYYIQFGEFRPRFYQIKKDGSISSRELHLYAKEILSMEEVTE
jgi:hypothetical protein